MKKNSIVLALVFCITSNFGCNKFDILSANELEKLSPQKQEDLISDYLKFGKSIDASIFFSCDEIVQAKVFSKLNSRNMGEIWVYKLKLLQEYMKKKEEALHLERLSRFANSYFIQGDKSLPEKEAKSLLSEGKPLFGDRYFSMVGTPVFSQNLANQLFLVGSGVPDVAACKCSVISDFCSSGSSCISPRLYCNENSDLACGLFLLFDCDGVCLKGGTE